MKNMKLNLILNLSALSSWVILATLTGCGSTSTQETTSVNTGAVTAASTTSSTASAGNIYNLPIAQSQKVQFGGNSNTINSATINSVGANPLTTSKTLKVKIIPLPAPNLTIINSAGNFTNWVFPYGCFSVTVTVNGYALSTEVLQVAGVTQGSGSQCASAPTSQVLDFSQDMTGYGPVTVVLNDAQYDNCRYQWPFNYGCSMSQIWNNHQVAANVTVQTDGEWLDP